MPHTLHRRSRSRFRLNRLRGLWRRDVVSSDAHATLVDAEPGTAILRRSNRVADIIAAHDAGRPHDAERRPRANPAFAEAVFVELMRARLYRRAFDLLSSDCRCAWGSADAFAAAQAQGSMSRLRGMRVKAVRHLPEWIDPERNITHHQVAELEVEYTLGADEATVVRRVVHLVADSGKWRSLCYPAGTDR